MFRSVPEVRFARRCWVSETGVEKDIVAVRAGDAYVVGTALDD
jgi:hypoxanthine-guanine phosphoribosyltransferase